MQGSKLGQIWRSEAALDCVGGPHLGSYGLWNYTHDKIRHTALDCNVQMAIRVLWWGHIAKLVQVISCTAIACILLLLWELRHAKCYLRHQNKATHPKYSINFILAFLGWYLGLLERLEYKIQQNCYNLSPKFTCYTAYLFTHPCRVWLDPQS